MPGNRSTGAFSWSTLVFAVGHLFKKHRGSSSRYPVGRFLDPPYSARNKVLYGTEISVPYSLKKTRQVKI